MTILEKITTMIREKKFSCTKSQFDQIMKSLGRIERQLQIIKLMEQADMSATSDILDKVTRQTTLVESVRVLVQQLKDAAADPAELAAIVAGLDANNTVLALTSNTPEA